MQRSMRVLLVLAACLVQLDSVWSQSVTCSSNQTDTSCVASTSCKSENNPDDLNGYIEMCEPDSNRPFIMSDLLDMQEGACTNDPTCSGADTSHSTKDEGKPEVYISLETVNIYRFKLDVLWKHDPIVESELSNVRRGYRVQILRSKREALPTDEDEFVQCFCVNDSDARNLTIMGSFELTFDYSYDGNLIVSVAPYPLPTARNDLLGVTGKNFTRWPRSCMDLGPQNCPPPKYPSPSNVQLHSYNMSESEETMRLDISWDVVILYPEWNYSRHNLTYYVQIRRFHSSGLFQVSNYFRVRNVGNSSRISVSVFPLYWNVTYADVSLLAHYPCAGLAYVEENTGCGNKFSDFFPLPKLQVSTSTAPSPSLPSASITLTIPTTSPSPTMLLSPMDPGEDIDWKVIVAAVVIMTALVIIAFTASIVFLLIRRRWMSMSKPSPSNSDDRIDVNYIYPIPVLTPITPEKKKRTFIFYTPSSENKEYILVNVAQALQLAGDIEVFSLDLMCVRVTIAQKIEEEVRQADAVFIVCDEMFEKDWERETSPHVNAMRHIIHTKVMTSDFKKFAVVTLEDECQCIPSDYLKSLTRFNVRESRSEDVELMVHFVRNTSLYELAPVESGAISPLSEITMRICSPDHRVPVTTYPSSTETLSSRSSSYVDTSSMNLSQEGTCENSRTLELQ